MWKLHDFVKDRTTKPGTTAILSNVPPPPKPKETPKPETKSETTEKVKETKQVVKQPRKELDGKKWIVEYQKGNLVTIEGSVDQRIYMFDCEDNTVKVTGKVNTITVDKCRKTKFVFDSVISQVEGSLFLQLYVFNKII